MTKHAQTYALDPNWRTMLTDVGVTPADVLRRAGLGDDLLQQPAVRLPSADYYRLWDSVEAATGDALFPIRLSETIRSESFSPPLFAALCSPNLLVAAQRVAKYETLIGPMRIDVAEGRSVLTIELTWLDAPPTPPVSLVLFKLLLTVSLARMGTRELVRPVEITTTVLPSPLAPYEQFLGARIRQGPKHRLVFAMADATRPFLTSNESLWAAFESDLRQRLASLDTAETTAKRVRAALFEGLPSGLVTMRDVARKLALSTRTLQRQIKAEGSSYQGILTQTRESLARHYLEKTALPVAEISFLLGFGEPTSFYRAFRTWTGTTPQTVRHARSQDP